MFQNAHSFFFLIRICLIPSDWQNILIIQTQALIGPDPWPSQKRDQTVVESRFFYLLLEAALSRTDACWCTTQKVHVLTVRPSLSFTKAQMSLWTIQTVPFINSEFPLQKCFWWSYKGLRNMWGHKCKEGGVGGPVALSSWGCDVHSLSPVLGSTSKMLMPGRISYCRQTMFLVTLILLLRSDQRQKPDTQLWTASSPKMAWVSEMYCPSPPLCNISWPSKMYYLSLENRIALDLWREGNTELNILHLVPRRGLFLKSHGSLVAKSYETQDTLSWNTARDAIYQATCYRAIYTRRECVRGNSKTTTSHPWSSLLS